MDYLTTVGKSHQRTDTLDKTTGAAQYTADYTAPGLMYARLITSPHAHANIKSIDISAAQQLPGTKAILTGEDFPFLTGSLLKDRPVLAVNKVRYHGEPVAVVVASSDHEAKLAAQAISVEYEPLSVVNSVQEATKVMASLVHENLGSYEVIKPAAPEPKTNIAHRQKIRKGNMKQGWKESDIVIEENFSYPKSDHAAMETRCVRARISPDGQVTIYSASQAPFVIKKLISRYFNVDAGKVIVHTPFVGGSFGGKASVGLEFIAYMAAKAVDGNEVKLTISREQDMLSAPGHIGLEAKVKLGCTKDGIFKAAELTYSFDGGAYADQGLAIARAAAVDCTGPYRIEHVSCDSLCVYTNHPYATSFRGFGHSELMFAIERSIDILAKKLNIDSLELRLRNAIVEGDTTPSQVVLTNSNVGSLSKCLARLKTLINWEEGSRIELDNGKVRAKGIGCLWKAPTSAPNATSGAIATFNHDGSLTLSIGAVEVGQGTKTILGQILAERLKVDISQVHVTTEINTQTNPEHWKTVASTATFMVGNAVLEAAEDIIAQLRQVGSIALRCSPEQLEVGYGKVYLKHNPNIYIETKDIATGFMFPNGNAIGGHIFGHGNFITQHLTHLDPETGKGTPGPSWTVGVQAIEVELDLREYTYKVIKAVTVMDPGKVINPKLAESVTIGGMCMGIGIASQEAFVFDQHGIVQNPNFRGYKLMRIADAPEYSVDFIESPQIDGPYGARGLGEHGVIGIPGALANAISVGAEADFNQLPITSETIWRMKEGK